MNIGGCCTGLRAQLNADKLQKLLQILRFIPTKGSADEMPEFEAIIEDVKNFLKDVDDFLSNTLKKEKLKKETNTRKEQLLYELNGLRSRLPPEKIEEDLEEEEEYTDVQAPAATSNEDSFMIEEDSQLIYDDTAPTPMDTTVSSSDPDQTMKTDSGEHDDNGNDIDDNRSVNWDEPYGDMKIAPIAASELDTPFKTGWLEKKRKEGNIGLSGWQRRYCVIKANVLYYYKKDTDKKQCNCVVLNGYEGRPATKQKKNQYLFEVVCPAKRSFQFIAKSETEMMEWIEAISKASSSPPDVTLAEISAGTVSNASSSSRENLLDNQELETNMNTTADTDDFYDDTAAEPSLEPQSSLDQDSKDYGETYEVVETTGTGSSSAQDEDFTEIGEDDELYEDVATTIASISPGRPPKQEPRMPLPAAPEPTVPVPSPKPIALLPGLPTSRPQPPLPTAPSPIIPTNHFNPPLDNEPWEEDYDNIYIGKWDCNPDDKDELGFNRGDLLHIISREYDLHNWWVAEKCNKVGLVPKDYLMKAYMM